jgi:dolichyl-phosphate beta-glucosyltransferase
MNEIDISVIIPAYNEESRIGTSLLSALEFLNKTGNSFEILVVDDGSSDNTSGVAGGIDNTIKVLVQPRNMGKGAAVRRGMLESKGKIRIFSDADFSTPIYELPKILASLHEGYDICIGSRALRPELIKKHQPFYREFMGKTFNKIIQVLLFRGIKDTQCGFKGFTDKSADKLFSDSVIDGFGFDVEILYLARKYGFKVKEEPVEWYNDQRSTVSPIKDSLKMIIEIFRIRKLHKKN